MKAPSVVKSSRIATKGAHFIHPSEHWKEGCYNNEVGERGTVRPGGKK